MIRIDEIWLATEPLDMRAGPDTALARVIAVFGAGFSPGGSCPEMNVTLSRKCVFYHH